jgi:TolB-like protein/Tfp pilus assembly protein PilF
MSSFFRELKRRNVYKVAVAYAVVAWLLIQLASILFPTFEAPPWVMKVFIAVMAAGFVIAVIIAWAFEMTPEGLKRTENISPEMKLPYWSRRKFAALIGGIALLAAGLFVFQLARPVAVPKRANTNDKSIAVLPFASLSEDKANAYFAVGIQDELLTRLAKIGDLKVISRTSTQQYESKPGNIPEIARQLGVAHILEGSVQKAGDSVRVNVQLIKAETDSHLWAETYDRKLVDVFAVETEIAEKIARSLAAKLTGREKEAISYISTKVPAAYDAYLRGIALRNSQSREGQERLLQFCRQAVALDPEFAAAWAEIAFAEGLRFIQGNQSAAQEAIVKEAAANALRLDPEHGSGHAAWGLYLYYCLQDYDGALIELQEAREQAPNDAFLIQAIGLVKRRQGKLDEAIDLQFQASGLDPRNEDIWANLGFTYRGMRKLADARAMFDRALALAPNERSLLIRKADTYIAEGDLGAASRIHDQLQLRFGEEGYDDTIWILELQRKYDGAIAKITADLKASDSPDPEAVALAHLVVGALHIVSGRRNEGEPLVLQAEAEMRALRDGGSNNPALAAWLLEIQALLGRRAEVERMATELVASHAKDRWRGPGSEQAATRAYMILGEKERVIANLERLLVQPSGSSWTPALLRLDPLWDPIRNDPRFQKLASGKP